MNVAKMFASLAVVIVSIAVVKPLIAVVSMCVMCLVKRLLIYWLRHAFNSYEEHSDHHRFENEVTHPNRLHKAHHNVQIQFTNRDFWP